MTDGQILDSVSHMFNSLVESMNEVSRPEYCKVNVTSVADVVSEVKEEGLPPA